jgi:ADP-ribose pyrophosphatase
MNDRILPDNAHLVPKNAKCVFKGVIFDVYQWQQEMYDGTYETFEMLKRPDTVLIIAIDNDEIIVLDEEQPNGIIRNSSLPAGRVDSTDESILMAAQRELVEETGLQFAKWALLKVTQPQSKLEWFMYVYIATEKTGEIPTKHDVGEKITIKRVSFDEFKQKQGDKLQELAEVYSIEQLLAKVNLV